jgi:Fic family protein
MKTFERKTDPTNVPISTKWLLESLQDAISNPRLRRTDEEFLLLRQRALVESTISSNRIEGVTIDHSRAEAVVFGSMPLYDSNEREVRGYVQALKLIAEKGVTLQMSEETILQLHSISRATIGDAGQYRTNESDIIEKYADGRERVRFKTVAADDTPTFMRKLIEAWRHNEQQGRIHPLIAAAAMNLDFLCIHPFRDGNGRVSRLLLQLPFSRAGYVVGRYVSLERLIEAHKERYYETLEQSSQRWHEGKHDPWLYINFILFILKSAYREFEETESNSA